jgi:hypothetical protein
MTVTLTIVALLVAVTAVYLLTSIAATFRSI